MFPSPPGASVPAVVSAATAAEGAASDAGRFASASSGAAQIDLPPAQRMFADSDALDGATLYGEPAATSADNLRLEVPSDLQARDAEGQAAAAADLALVRDAFVAAGAGATTAKAIFADAIRAARAGTLNIDPVKTMDELRSTWGAATDSKIAAARALVAKAAEKAPGIIEFLERTRLGDDPAFIRKLAARAARMGRSR
jgi:hypothetical protein